MSDDGDDLAIRAMLTDAELCADELIRRDPLDVDAFANQRIIRYHCMVALGMRRAHRDGSKAKSRAWVLKRLQAMLAEAPQT